jgi:hypothetical protein
MFLRNFCKLSTKYLHNKVIRDDWNINDTIPEMHVKTQMKPILVINNKMLWHVHPLLDNDSETAAVTRQQP